MVVLCHGISSNHHFWDLDPEHSLAVYLHDSGFDVWNMDLRGHGLATRQSTGKRQPRGWTVDDYGLFDLPAAFSYVAEQTGTPQIHYVGHSLGGMVLAIHLSSTPDSPVERAVVVGSPLSFHAPTSLTKLMLGNARRLSLIRRWPTPLLATGLSWFGTNAPLSADIMLFQPDNMDKPVRRRMLNTVVSPIVAGELRQFGQSTDGWFYSADGRIRYDTALSDVNIPMLFIAGRGDHVAPPDSVRSYFDAIGSPDKAFIVASRVNGFAADYGHLDLGLGDHAAAEIYPRIRQFLQQSPQEDP
ncbi:MAG: pimeloyl-ACP methyl ester carboxylesterase [Myxococcota bacterium]